MAPLGRPRSVQARRKILDAALQLARTRGYAELTVEGIAAAAGVGKQTIYRWWPSKAAVVLEALRENARAEIEVPDTGELHTDLEGFLRSTFESPKRRPGIERVLRAMMAEAQHDDELAKVVRSGLIEPRREALRGIFQRAIARGEISSVQDLDLWADIAFGVLWYRLLAEVGPLDDELAESLAGILSEAAGAKVRD